MRIHEVKDDGKLLGKIYLREGYNKLFLVGYKGVSVKTLFDQIFEDLQESFVIKGSIGALDNIQLGYRNNQTQEYEITTLTESHELLSLNGNVGLKPNGEIFSHIHGSFSDESCLVKGGHIVDGNISITLECFIEPLGLVLEREHDKDTGLDLISKAKDSKA